MTEQEFREYLEEWVKDYCRNSFESGLPGGVKIFLDKAYIYFKEQAGKTNESLGDYSIGFQVTENGIPSSYLSLLHPYRKIGTI
jgi:hypothetical protein